MAAGYVPGEHVEVTDFSNDLDAKHHSFTTRDEWIPHVKKHATTCYHAAGTCKMGQVGDGLAVLDEKLFVRGVKGLRVADCSVMPTLHGGHTQMPA